MDPGFYWFRFHKPIFGEHGSKDNNWIVEVWSDACVYLHGTQTARTVAWLEMRGEFGDRIEPHDDEHEAAIALLADESGRGLHKALSGALQMQINDHNGFIVPSDIPSAAKRLIGAIKSWEHNLKRGKGK